MKKLYSLVAVLALSAAVSAQGSENFEAQTALTASYANGSFTGQTSGVTVTYVASRDQGTTSPDIYAISGKGLMLRRNDDPSSVEFSIPNGVGTFTYRYRKAFTGGADRVLAVFVDGVQVSTTDVFGSGTGDQNTIYTSTTAINKTGVVKVKISYPTGTSNGNRQATVDDISWTANTLAVGDLSSAKAILVKNTVVADVLSFGAKADVQIINMNGQVVKSASVTESTILNVSSLSKGNYIVTGTVNGEKVSQKIIKK